MAGDTPHRYLFLVRDTPEGSTPRPLPLPNRAAKMLEWTWQNYCQMRERVEWLADDALPYLNMLTGTELFAESFGCQVHRPEDQMPAARPLVFSAAQAAKLKVPAIDAPPLKRDFDMADELRRRAGSGAPFRTVDVQSPMDIAALIWDKMTSTGRWWNHRKRLKSWPIK